MCANFAHVDHHVDYLQTLISTPQEANRWPQLRSFMFNCVHLPVHEGRSGKAGEAGAGLAPKTLGSTNESGELSRAGIVGCRVTGSGIVVWSISDKDQGAL